jgi:hypothetical protein
MVSIAGLPGSVKAREARGLSLAVVRDLREARIPAGPEELAAFETDVLAGFVLARAAAGLSDNTIRSDVLHLEQLRAWFGGRCGMWSRLTLMRTSARCCGMRRRAPGCRGRRR